MPWECIKRSRGTIIQTKIYKNGDFFLKTSKTMLIGFAFLKR